MTKKLRKEMRGISRPTNERGKRSEAVRRPTKVRDINEFKAFLKFSNAK